MDVLALLMDAATILPMCGRYASFLPAEAMARIFGTRAFSVPDMESSGIPAGRHPRFQDSLHDNKAAPPR